MDFSLHSWPEEPSRLNGTSSAAERTAASRRQNGLVCLLLVLIGVFYCATIRPGHGWGDDFALYIHHAENIVTGHPYGDTGYIYNRSFPGVGPRTYPPIFPLLLAPIYSLYGMNLTAMKVEGIVLFLLTLLVVYVFFRSELPFPYLLAMLILMGLNPVLWNTKDNLVSDQPFVLFFYLSAFFAQYGHRNDPSWWRRAALTGIALYLCYGTRTIGLMLLPGLALHDLVRWRKLTRFTVLAAATCVAFIVVQWLLIGAGEGSYADEFRPTVMATVYNGIRYTTEMFMFWYPGPSLSYAKIFYALTVALALAGAYLRFRKGWTVLEFLLVFYWIFIVVWPKNQGFRFLLPVVPLYLYYMMLGLATLTRQWKGWRPAAALAALLLLAGVDYAETYRKADFGTIREANGNQNFNKLCQFVRASTSPKDVFLVWRPRAFALFTGRPASVYYLTGAPNDDATLWRYMAQIQVSYIVASKLFDNDRRYLQPFLERNRRDLDLVYEDAEFRLYRIKRLRDLAATESAYAHDRP